MNDEKITITDVKIVVVFVLIILLGIHILASCVNENKELAEQEEPVASIISKLEIEEARIPLFGKDEMTFVALDQEEVFTPVAEEPVPYVIDVTDEDIDLMARVVMSEASVLSMECKQAIASTIVNRVKSKRFPNSVDGVVHQKYQYSTQNNGKPNADCYAAVQQALRYEEYPSDMYYFRMWHYHKFGTPYMEIDDCYFSTQ